MRKNIFLHKEVQNQQTKQKGQIYFKNIFRSGNSDIFCISRFRLCCGNKT